MHSEVGEQPALLLQCAVQAQRRFGPDVHGAVTKTWYTDGSEVVPTSEYGRNLPAVGAAMSVSFDHAKDMAYYEDSHGTTDVCGPNPKVARQSCS
jgi:hypothetical protein